MKEIIFKLIRRWYGLDPKTDLVHFFNQDENQVQGYLWMFALLLATVIVSLFIWWLTKFVLLRFVKSFAKRTKTSFDDLLVDHKFFDVLAHLLPLMFLDYFFGITFFAFPKLLDFSVRVNEVLIALVVLIALRRLMNTVGAILSNQSRLKDKPINSYIQTVKIVITIFFMVIMLSLLTGQSPVFFLTSIGAMTAIIILVFKDTILGFVGSIQMAANDMVRVGDWISMEKYGADGDVLEINLTTVKVQNWDRTITTIPTYSFIADSFKNWRGMSDSGGRRIKRAFYIQLDSVKFASPRLIDRLSNVQGLKDFIENRQAEIKTYNEQHGLDEEQINARRQTNVGLLRRYLDYYLKNHERIHQGMTIMVRQLEPTANGLPIEIYCFTSTIAWLEYEEIQSDIFDHIFAVVKDFELVIHEAPSGEDIRKYLTQQSNG